MTATQEEELKMLEREAAANPDKWKVGDGVGWKLPGQINRGFRIQEIDRDTKLALIRPVADTGLTITGGGMEGIGPEWIHIGHLIRDKKYDTPIKKESQVNPEIAKLRLTEQLQQGRKR